MKKLLISLVLAIGLLSSHVSVAQDGAVDKKPIIEIFTSSTCPPCVSGNLRVDGILANNPDAYSLVKYQMSWPGDGDPYYLESSGVRRSYYEVTGVPHIRTNGFSPGYPQNWTQTNFDALAGKTNISITAEGSVTVGTPATAGASTSEAMTVNCHVEIKAHAAYSAGLRVYIIVVERNTFGNAATNGETIFHNVVQGYMVSSEGVELGALAADEVKTFDLSLDLADTFTETGNDLTLVVFVQNHATKDVKQSEMVEITHPFVDYSASFNVFDEDFNPVDGGRISIALAGEEKIVNSMAEASGILPGDYSYEIVVPGLFPYDGDFSITDADVQQDVFLEIPPFYFYEDFENPGLPTDWTYVIPSGVSFYEAQGQVLFYQPADGDDAVYAIFPKLNIDQGCNMSFKAGNSSGRSYLAVGVITDPEDPAASFTEIVNLEIYYADHMHGLGARFDNTAVGDGYLCFKITSGAGNWFYLDNVIIIENIPGYKVQFVVKDQQGEILPDVEVIMIDEGIQTNTFGYATWRNVDPADYDYAITYNGIEFETGTITVDGDILKEIVYNTSGIEGFEVDPVHIYPNPAQDVIIVKGFAEGKVQILDLDGRIIREQSLSGQTSIQVADLAEGIYLVKISAGEETITKKLFITK
ncbi:MAG: T9SS type A sorting domain-containing protein [Bacteroidota bacterium]|nr:T9SS type A sorting domain-containing protein [Bacteroidota bacterium]